MKVGEFYKSDGLILEVIEGIPLDDTYFCAKVINTPYPTWTIGEKWYSWKKSLFQKCDYCQNNELFPIY